MERKWLKLIVYSAFAGVCIGFAAILYLYGLSLAPVVGIWEKTIAGLLFGFGLYFVIVMEYKLFTGMVARLVDMKPKEWFQLVVCYVFNTLAILVLALLVWAMQNSVSEAVIGKAVSVTEGKLGGNLFGSFVSAMFCGMMITFAVTSHQRARGKGLSGTLGIIFPVLLFVYMGFEHCIANQAYIFLAVIGKANIEPLRLLLFAAITAAGNVVGGIIFPLLTKAAESLKKQKAPENAKESPVLQEVAAAEDEAENK